MINSSCGARSSTTWPAGGHFVVEVQMPNLAAFADSFSSPPRVATEVDLDVTDPQTKSRLLRHKSTSYVSSEQKASIRFVYERFEKTVSVERYIDDFASHVYFPRELQLLFMHTGFEVDAVYGDYHFRPLEPASQVIIMIGRKLWVCRENITNTWSRVGYFYRSDTSTCDKPYALKPCRWHGLCSYLNRRFYTI